jgi:hypothetical protein
MRLKGAVLRSGLADQVVVGFLDLRILRRVNHRLVDRRDARGTLGVYSDVFGLSLEVDPVFAGVLLCDCDDAGVRACCALDDRSAW